MQILKNTITYTGYEQQKANIDVYLCPGNEVKMALFYHGFKGFKDWGNWQQMAAFFNQEGISLALMNGTHNGVVGNGTEIVELEKFANNTLEAEQVDIAEAWAHLEELVATQGAKIIERHAIGHSRGAAAMLVYAAANVEITTLSMWAGVGNYTDFFKFADTQKWRKEGVTYIVNSRTGQQLPVNSVVLEEFEAHNANYDLHKLASAFGKPLLLVHGTEDKVVPLQQAMDLYNNCLHSVLIKIEGAGHTFDCSFESTSALPASFVDCVQNTVDFISDFEEDDEF